MSNEELQAIRERAEKARYRPLTGKVTHEFMLQRVGEVGDSTADVPALLAEVEQLRTALREALQDIGWHNQEYRYRTPPEKLEKWTRLAKGG